MLTALWLNVLGGTAAAVAPGTVACNFHGTGSYERGRIPGKRLSLSPPCHFNGAAFL